MIEAVLIFGDSGQLLFGPVGQRAGWKLIHPIRGCAKILQTPLMHHGNGGFNLGWARWHLVDNQIGGGFRCSL